MFRFEEYLRSWMKKIQELLLESEQLRLETDDAGPQVNIFFQYGLKTEKSCIEWITSIHYNFINTKPYILSGWAGVLEVACGQTDLAGGADQHHAMQDDVGGSQNSAVQTYEGKS